MQDVIRRNHVQTLGEGDQTLVLAHGFGCDQQIWQPVAETPCPLNTSEAAEQQGG